MILGQFASIENFGLLADLNLGLLIMEILLFVSSLFLMLLILVQRGKGGGLTGALGGMGGQSAFGSKAGDAFTKITIITAVIWIMLCMVTIAAFNPPPTPKETVNNDAEISEAMKADPNDTPPVIDQAEDATADGTSADETTTDGAQGEDGVDLNLEPPVENADSTGSGESKTDPDDDGN